jgi:hypothetical protein
MGDVVSFPTSLEDNAEFVADCCSFAENILSEAAVKKKYRFSDEVWAKLGEDDALVEKIEAEKVRRLRNGQQKRERAQLLVVQAPDVLSNILNDAGQSARHRIDSAKTLNDFASGGSEAGAAASDLFQITINIGPETLTFSKPIKPDSNPNHIDDTPQEEWLPVITANERKDGDDGQSL